jgi:transcriptional regulator with XRE-family HTH domain
MHTKGPLTLLRQLREAAGLTQADMAAHFGMTGANGRNVVARWENGVGNLPAMKHRIRFMTYLGTKLGLRHDRQRFGEVWQIFEERWKWPAITDREWMDHVIAVDAELFSSSAEASTHSSVFISPDSLSKSADLVASTYLFHPRVDFVGRIKEIEEFTKILDRHCQQTDTLREFPELFLISGEGGIGKTWLLNELCSISERKGCQVFPLSFHDIEAGWSEENIISVILQKISENNPQIELAEFNRVIHTVATTPTTSQASKDLPRISQLSAANLIHEAIHSSGTSTIGYVGPVILRYLLKSIIDDINRIASSKVVVISFDRYDNIDRKIQLWLYSNLINKLSGNIILLMAGQRNIGADLTGTINGFGIHNFGLNKFSLEELILHLIRRDIEPRTDVLNKVMEISQGIPLAVEICILSIKRGGAVDFLGQKENQVNTETVEGMVRYLISDLTPEEQEVLFAMCALRYFSEEMLAYTLQVKDTAKMRQYIHKFPFIDSLESGLRVHNRIRLFVIPYLRKNRPHYIRAFHNRASKYWASYARTFQDGIDESMFYSRDGWGTCINSQLYHLIQWNEVEGLEFFLNQFVKAMRVGQVFFNTLIGVIYSEELYNHLAITPKYAELADHLMEFSHHKNAQSLRTTLDEFIQLARSHLSTENTQYLEAQSEQILANDQASQDWKPVTRSDCDCNP